MVHIYAQSASGSISLANSELGGRVYAHVFLNGVQKALIKYSTDSNNPASLGFSTSPTVYAFISPTDNPKITVKVSSTQQFFIVKEVPLVFTTIGLKK